MDNREKAVDIVYAVTKAGIGSLPIAGGILSELFGLVITDPASKRRENLLQDIVERLNVLEQKGIDMEELANNEEFLSIVLQVYHISLRTHQVEKRVALLNAITNTPMLNIEENIKQMFLMYIDSFNEWHLRILAFLDNPSNYFLPRRPDINMGAKSSLLQQAFPELKEKRGFYDQVVKDLYSRGLINMDSLHVTMSESGLWNSSTTETGKQFLSFIREQNA